MILGKKQGWEEERRRRRRRRRISNNRLGVSGEVGREKERRGTGFDSRGERGAGEFLKRWTVARRRASLTSGKIPV